MTVAAILLVKDEADVIEYTVRHFREQVDHVFVADNGSTDGTREILDRLARERADTWSSPWLSVLDDPEVGYYQARKMTALAAEAYAHGFSWVVPADADELWYSPFGRIADVLEDLPEGQEALFASAGVMNHLATGADDDGEPNPFVRLRWHLVEPNALPKVACRTDPSLRIGMGNHEATVNASVRSGRSSTVYEQLWIHHYAWRSEEQFLRKITNGARAYAAAPDIGKAFGRHWRDKGMPEDAGFEEAVRGWFREWGWRDDPLESHAGGELIDDPGPYSGREP